jgi:hypothetical protein
MQDAAVMLAAARDSRMPVRVANFMYVREVRRERVLQFALR